MEADQGQPALSERLTSVKNTLDNAKGKLFPSFSRTEQPRETLVLGHKNYEDGQVRALFLRYRQSLYAFVDKAAWLVLHNLDAGVPIPLPSSTGPRGPAKLINNMMGPVQLHNSVQELHKLFTRAQQEGPGRAPNIQEAQDLISYLHLWNRYKLPRSDLISLMIKVWRPPAWAAERARTKKVVLQEIGRSWRVENTEASTTTRQSNPQDIICTQAPAAPAIAGPNPVVPATSHRAPLEERIMSNSTERSSGWTREQAPPPQEIRTMHQEA